MKKLHGKTYIDITIEQIDEGIEITPDTIKIIELIVEAYGEE